MSDSKPPPVPRPKPIGRQSSHSPSEIAQAQAVMDDVVRDHISDESPLPADYETQTDDTPTPDRREATLPRRLADVANALVPARWLFALIMFLLGIAGGLVAVGVVWGQTITEVKTGVVEAKADAAEAKTKATPVGELKGKLDLTMKKTDEAAGDVKKLATETAAARQDIAVMQAQQTAAHAVIDQKLNDIAADLKVLVRAARK